MPLLLGTKGNDILQWRTSAALVATLEESLAGRWASSSARDTESFLESFIDTLRDELAYETQFLRETSALDEAIEAAPLLNQLPPMQARYREVISAHFRRRQSVLALCESCNRLHDEVLAKALSLASERMLQLGQGSAPVHAVLVSGDRGRGEQTLQGENRYFLLREDDSPRFYLFIRQVSALLKDAGLLSGDQMFWHGSLDEWRGLLAVGTPAGEAGEKGISLAALPPFAPPVKQGPQEMPDWQWRLESLTDLCFVRGDARLASEALSAAGRTVQEERHRGQFMQLARRVIGLPLALGRFGRWRLRRTGEHQGELNLDELALGPLVMTTRVLAVHAGVDAVGTVERIKALLEKGALDVELAERLLKAYQCFMQLKIVSEIRSEESGAFCNPDEFDEAEAARFKSSLEAVLNLQKIGYQRIVGQG